MRKRSRGKTIAMRCYQDAHFWWTDKNGLEFVSDLTNFRGGREITPPSIFEWFGQIDDSRDITRFSQPHILSLTVSLSISKEKELFCCKKKRGPPLRKTANSHDNLELTITVGFCLPPQWVKDAV